jgi:uncharacterized protein (TIGR01777 family)
MSTILITGGTGLIGSALKTALQQEGHRVLVLTRQLPVRKKDFFHWNPDTGFVDPNALVNTDVIFHLAGASIADHRWTPEYKKTLLESRTRTTALLAKCLHDFPNKVKSVIATSAIGIYGNTGNVWIDENSQASKDFLGQLCVQWEDELRRFTETGKRLVILRTGTVLSHDGGMLKEMQKPVKLFVGAPIGSGQQYISWIHIDDLINMMLFALNMETLNGIFNAAAPEPATNKEFMQLLAKKLNRPLWPFKVPSWILSGLLGEKATIILTGQKVSSKKIISNGFNFKFTEIYSALEDLLHQRK